MSEQTQTTPSPGNAGTPNPPAAPAEPHPSAIPAAPASRGSAIPAGEQQAPAGPTPAASEAPSALVPGSGNHTTSSPDGVPVDWRKSLPPELQKETSLGHINTVEDLAKSYVHAQKALGGPKISVPDPKLATPEDYRNVFKKLGLPEEQKDYKVESAPDSGLDPQFLKDFQENAFKAGVLPKQAQELLNWYTEASKGIVGNLQKQNQDQLIQQHKELQTEWGKAYPQKLLAAQLVVKDFGDEQSVKFMQESGLHQNPQFLKFLSKIGETLKEPELKGSAGRGTPMRSPAEAMSEANRIIADSTHPYNVPGHPNHKLAVSEVEQLFEMAHPNVDEK